MRVEPTTPSVAHTVIDPHDATGWTGMETIKSLCLGIVLLEIQHMGAQENALLTPWEAARSEELGPGRRKMFIAARVALKKLARQIGLAHENTPDFGIETLGPDRVRPCLAESKLRCSVAHTKRLAVAVAQDHPVGVDIETVSPKPVRIWHLFMLPQGDGLLSASALGPERTATRAWTVMEAAAKAFRLSLSEAIREVKIDRVGEMESIMRYRGRAYSVQHAEGEGHVLSLLVCRVL